MAASIPSKGSFVYCLARRIILSAINAEKKAPKRSPSYVFTPININANIIPGYAECAIPSPKSASRRSTINDPRIPQRMPSIVVPAKTI